MEAERAEASWVLGPCLALPRPLLLRLLLPLLLPHQLLRLHLSQHAVVLRLPVPLPSLGTTPRL